MKTILIITIILQLSLSVAQDEIDDKPSWSEELPEMIDAPEIDLDSSVDTNIEFDMEELGMERRDMFDDSQDDTTDEPDFSLNVQADTDITDEDNQAVEDIAAAEKAAAEKVALEKIAQEKAAAEKAALEQAAAEQLALEKASAEQAASEKAASEKIAQEKAAADQLAKEQADAEISASQQDIAVKKMSPESSQDLTTYKWTKIKNSIPQYPLKAARSGEEGWVDVEVEINPNGEVVSANSVNSFRNARTFNRAAINAVKEWMFEPPINSGIEENQFRIFKIRFKL